MSRLLSSSDYADVGYELGDRVEFTYGGGALTGTVVRVYNTRTVYHVEVRGQRYEVEAHEILGLA